MANERVVEFAVKARDEYSKVLANLAQQQTKLSAAAQAASRRAVVGVAKSQIDDAIANYKRLTSEVGRYQSALDAGRKSGSLAEAEMRELAETIALTRARSREAISTINQHRSALNQMQGSATSGYAAFNRMATAMEQDAAASNAAAAQLVKLTTNTNAAANAQGILKKKADATTASLNRQAGKSPTASPSSGKTGVKGEAQSVDVFGLKPYQLTNLGYQVNDVVSGLAMGQRPLQVLAQQAGQFAQIWPNVMVSLARSIPIIAGVTAVLTPFIVAALRLQTTAESVRIFTQVLTLSADGSKYSAQNLALAVDQMGKFGIATEAARTIVKQFIADGIAEKDILPLTKMAQQLDAITGEGVADAGKRLSSAFSGTMDDVRDLDKQLNFLTADQYKQIEAMAKAGDGAGAMARAQAILAGKLADSADKGDDWTKAVNSLSTAWDNLLNTIQKSGLLQEIARQTKYTVDMLTRGADKLAAASNAINNLNQSNLPAQQQVDILNQQIAQQQKLASEGSIIGTTFDTAELIKQRDALLVILDARRDELQTIKDATAAQKEASALTESDQKARLDIQSALDKQGEALTLETKQAELTNRERYIEGQLLEAKNTALAKAKELNQDILGLTAEQTKQIRDQAGMTYDATHVNYEAQYTAQRNSGTPQAAQMAELVAAVSKLAEKMQISAKDLLTAMSYETKGTFDPSIKGGAGGQYAGLIQFSPANQAKYGVNAGSSVTAQVDAAGKYLADAGVKAGDSLLQIYAAINAGNAKNIYASDEKNGGTAGDVLTKVGSDMMSQHADKAAAVLAAYEGIAEQAKKTAEYEKDFAARTAAAQAELDAKTKETRQAAINKAIVDETNRAKKAGTEATKEELALVAQIAGKEFDRAHADDQVNQLVAQRTALFQSLQIAQEAGDQGKVASTIDLISQVEEKLKTAIPAAIAFWQAIGGSGADQEIAKLQAIQEGIGQTLQKLDKQFLPQAQQLNEQLADIGGNAFSAFAQALANGENSAQAFFDALKQGLADFLIEIGKAIIKQALFNALSGGAGAGGSGGVGGAISGWITSLFHEGGVIGESAGSGSRMVNPAIFANAARHHGGGMVGSNLKPGEVPIVALQGEEVLTGDDPRHIRNGGGRGQAVNLKNVNVFDPADVLEHALATLPGERVLLNFLSRNSRKIQAAITS